MKQMKRDLQGDESRKEGAKRKHSRRDGNRVITNQPAASTSRDVPTRQLDQSLRIKFTKITEIAEIGMKYNLYGVISAVLDSRANFCKIVHIRDETCPPDGEFRIHIFYRSESLKPKLQLDRVVRLMNVKIENYEGLWDGRVYFPDEVATFPAEAQGLAEADCPAEGCTFSRADVVRINELRAWMTSGVYSSNAARSRQDFPCLFRRYYRPLESLRDRVDNTIREETVPSSGNRESVDKLCGQAQVRACSTSQNNSFVPEHRHVGVGCDENTIREEIVPSSGDRESVDKLCGQMQVHAQSFVPEHRHVSVGCDENTIREETVPSSGNRESVDKLCGQKQVVACSASQNTSFVPEHRHMGVGCDENTIIEETLFCGDGESGLTQDSESLLSVEVAADFLSTDMTAHFLSPEMPVFCPTSCDTPVGSSQEYVPVEVPSCWHRKVETSLLSEIKKLGTYYLICQIQKVTEFSETLTVLSVLDGSICRFPAPRNEPHIFINIHDPPDHCKRLKDNDFVRLKLKVIQLYSGNVVSTGKEDENGYPSALNVESGMNISFSCDGDESDIIVLSPTHPWIPLIKKRIWKLPQKYVCMLEDNVQQLSRTFACEPVKYATEITCCDENVREVDLSSIDEGEAGNALLLVKCRVKRIQTPLKGWVKGFCKECNEMNNLLPPGNVNNVCSQCMKQGKRIELQKKFSLCLEVAGEIQSHRFVYLVDQDAEYFLGCSIASFLESEEKYSGVVDAMYDLVHQRGENDTLSLLLRKRVHHGRVFYCITKTKLCSIA